MSNAALEAAIEAAWEARDTITPSTGGETREAIEKTLNELGIFRYAQVAQMTRYDIERIVDWVLCLEGGRLVVPVGRGEQMLEVHTRRDSQIQRQRVTAVRFVPLRPR